jgi:hypothetical protein
MAHHTPTLSDHDVLTHARAGLGQHLRLQAEGFIPCQFFADGETHGRAIP